MDFEEKMDALRMNLELASHDIESLRESIESLRKSSEAQRESIEAQRGNIESLRESTRALQDASASQFESIRVLGKATEGLLATALQHDQRITGLEGRA